MQLTGSVTLDKQSESELRRQIRSEIIEEINAKGHTNSEIISFAKNLPPMNYYGFILETIKPVLDNSTLEDFTFQSNRAKFKKLEIIRDLVVELGNC